MHWPILSMERSMCRPLGAATFHTVRRVYVMPSKFMKYNNPPNPGQSLPQKMIYYPVCFILYRIEECSKTINFITWYPLKSILIYTIYEHFSAPAHTFQSLLLIWPIQYPFIRFGASTVPPENYTHIHVGVYMLESGN